MNNLFVISAPGPEATSVEELVDEVEKPGHSGANPKVPGKSQWALAKMPQILVLVLESQTYVFLLVHNWVHSVRYSTNIYMLPTGQ